MQPDRTRQNLIAIKNVEKSKAFILLGWDGDKLLVTEVSDIEDETELERFVLAAAAEGNDFLRRILKHRLER